MADGGVFTLELDEFEYRIVGPGGEVGNEVDYGDVAVLRIDPAIYYAVVDDPNADGLVVYRADSVTGMETKTEDVDFGEDEEEEEEGQEEEEEEEEEEVTVPGEPGDEEEEEEE